MLEGKCIRSFLSGTKGQTNRKTNVKEYSRYYWRRRYTVKKAERTKRGKTEVIERTRKSGATTVDLLSDILLY